MPRSELKRKLSVSHYDNLVLFNYFHSVLDEVSTTIGSIEASLNGIR